MVLYESTIRGPIRGPIPSLSQELQGRPFVANYAKEGKWRLVDRSS